MECSDLLEGVLQRIMDELADGEPGSKRVTIQEQTPISHAVRLCLGAVDDRDDVARGLAIVCELLVARPGPEPALV